MVDDLDDDDFVFPDDLDNHEKLKKHLERTKQKEDEEE